MKRLILLILLCCSLLETKATVYEKADIAICADLSYSTKGLLDALRQNMWYLMHYLTVYSPQPNVRIGMMCYGKIGFGRENNYIRLVSDLSNRMNALNSNSTNASLTAFWLTFLGKALAIKPCFEVGRRVLPVAVFTCLGC